MTVTFSSLHIVDPADIDVSCDVDAGRAFLKLEAGYQKVVISGTPAALRDFVDRIFMAIAAEVPA